MNPRSSHTHCQVAQADTQAKTCQRVCLPPTHGRQKRCSKLKGKMTENKEHQPLINRNMSGAQRPAIITG